MKWTISQLQKFRNKDFTFDDYADVSEIMKRDKQIRGVSQMHVTGRADINSTQAVFHMHITGELVLPCSRTLVDVNFPVDIETSEIFLLREEEADMRDYDVTVIEGEVLDLTPVIIELLLLEIPMQVFCEDSDAEGAAPQSGNDWSVVTEEEAKQKMDPRLAKLANFFDNDKDS